MRNFFIESTIPASGEVQLPAGEARHGLRVLRLQPGDIVGLLDGQGTIAEAEVMAATADRRANMVKCQVKACRHLKKSAPRITLYVAPPRSKQMDALVQAAAALGVHRIVPIKCRYSVAVPTAPACLAHWRQQAVAALKQSGNPYLPELLPPVEFAKALTTSEPGFYGGVPTGAAARRQVGDFQVADDCALWVGPEGGFSEDELAKLAACGLPAMMVGSWTLRVEVAVPALLAVLTGARVGV